MFASIPHSKPFLPSYEQWAEIVCHLAPGWAANGPCVEAFAREAALWLGGIGGVAVHSGTSALHLGLLASGVRPGSEVLVPAYCCAAPLNAVHLAGAIPVLVDAEPGGFNLCPEDARRRLTARSAAVVVAHMFGQPAPLAPFLELGIPIIEDCAQSLGATEEGHLTGSRGVVAVSSFYATKVMTTGQGGLVSTRDPQRLAVLRDLVQYDNRDEWRPRFSYSMSELQAALGLWQLDRLPWFLARRDMLAHYYDTELRDAAWPRPAVREPSSCSGLRGAWPCRSAGVQREPDGRVSVDTCPAQRRLPGGPICYRYLLRVRRADRIIDALQARGIDARRPVYRPLHHYLGGDYPHAQTAYERIVSLPLYPTLSDAEAESVVEAVQDLGPLLGKH